MREQIITPPTWWSNKDEAVKEENTHKVENSSEGDAE